MLPDDLFDSPKSKHTEAAASAKWHDVCNAGAVSEADTEAVKKFVDSFETVPGPSFLPSVQLSFSAQYDTCTVM